MTTGYPVVLLHGFKGLPGDLEPFARSLSVDAPFAFPEGPIDLASRGLRGRAWWLEDQPASGESPQTEQTRRAAVTPEGLDEARAHLDGHLDHLAPGTHACPIVLGGFSQGAMLACDRVLRSARPYAGLVLFSGARIAESEWRPRYGSRRGLRTFMSHGRQDRELSFEAADDLRQEFIDAGWDVTWCPFDGGHEIPLVVWRAFKRWLISPR